MFSALRYRDFRLLWFGLVVSNTGSWAQMVAQGWLVYLLTGSPLALGLVGFVRAVPVLAFSLFAGALADRVERRRILLVTQSIVMLLSFLLGTLTLLQVVQVWHVLLIAFLSAVAFAFDTPSRQSLVPDLVGKDDLVNALGLQSVAFNLAGVVGPALAALIIEQVGIAGAFYLNAASFLAVIAALLLMAPRPQRTPLARAGLLRNVAEGLRFIIRERALLGLVLLLTALSLLGRPFIQLLPVFARDVLQAGATGLGTLNALAGAGSLVGALAVAAFQSFRQRGLLLLIAAGVFSVALIAFASSTSYALSLALCLVLGCSTTFFQVNTNSMLQANSPAALRGRVVSIYTLIMMGFMPLGSMLLGSIGQVLGVPLTLAIAGAIILAVVVLIGVGVPRVRTLE